MIVLVVGVVGRLEVLTVFVLEAFLVVFGCFFCRFKAFVSFLVPRHAIFAGLFSSGVSDFPISIPRNEANPLLLPGPLPTFVVFASFKF